MRRRDFLQGALATAVSAALPAPARAPGFAVCGPQGPHQVLICGRGAEGASAARVRWSTAADLRQAQLVLGSRASAATDWTARAALRALPAGRRIYYELDFPGSGAAPVRGSFLTPPTGDQPLRFVWGGDVVGQGYGIDPSRGGMATFGSMLGEQPHLFLHNGDSIYADDPLAADKRLDDGTVWHNLLTPEKQRVATTLADFRGNYRYNFSDPHYREFFAQVPVAIQWDDHEVRNNWSPREPQEALLARNSLQAFREYWPVGQGPLYRRLAYGPHLDVFVLDMRSYRNANGDNREPQLQRLLGRQQLEWLKQELRRSRATWKVVSGGLPIAVCTPQWGLDSWANGSGPPLGRELELAELLAFCRHHRIHNLVFLSADVHYAAAFEFHPKRAVFKNFDRFWEFVAGPLHAGTFGPPGPNDPTFGPAELFCGVSANLKPNRPPSEGLQFFGRGELLGPRLRISLHRRDGKEIYRQLLHPE